MNLTREDIAKLPLATRDAIYQKYPELRPKDVRSAALPVEPWKLAGFKSQLEYDFSKYLNTAALADGAEQGIRYEVRYETIKLKLTGHGSLEAWYTPDFAMMGGVLPTILYEVKGHWRTADRLRFKVAAGQYPCFRFYAVTRVDGTWKFEEAGHMDATGEKDEQAHP